MPQKFAFTTAAMAAALEETPVSYEDLADIEREFDDAETAISEFSAPQLAAWLLYHIRSSASTTRQNIKNTQPSTPIPTNFQF
jgi:hypothetical protein